MADSPPGGKVAVVIGVDVPIARDIATRLAVDGARLVVSGSDRASALLAAALHTTGARALAVTADASDAGGVANIFDAVVQAFGRVDVLVHAVARMESAVPFLDMDESLWDEVLFRRMKSVYLCSQRAARLIVQQGAGGCIITVSPFAGIEPAGSLAAYGALQGAIEAFTSSIARDLAPFGVRANVVIPAPPDAHRIAANGASAARPGENASHGALEGLGTRDAASVVAFLISDAAVHVTGQAIHVNDRSASW